MAMIATNGGRSHEGLLGGDKLVNILKEERACGVYVCRRTMENKWNHEIKLPLTEHRV